MQKDVWVVGYSDGFTVLGVFEDYQDAVEFRNNNRYGSEWKITKSEYYKKGQQPEE
jgi:hypothetical protein